MTCHEIKGTIIRGKIKKKELKEFTTEDPTKKNLFL
jgi:hypothetical protein